MKLESDDYSIVSIDTKPASNEGDNYMSLLVRSKVEIEMKSGTKQTQIYIVKALISTEFNKNIINECAAFPKEQKMYSRYLPDFEKLYADEGVCVTFGPKSYYTTNEPTPMIVMKDLSGYEMTKRTEGFNEAQVEHGLCWMAQFHAASMVYKEKITSYGEDFNDGVFSMKIEPTYQVFLDSYMNHYLIALKKLPQGERYLEKVESWKGNLFSLISKTLTYDENAFNVLNHGDAWGNNFMFQYDNDHKLKDIKLVDYQLCFWGSVAHDLYYFMMSSWNMEFKIKKFDHFIRFYYNHLIENLKVLKYSKKLPTFDDLEQELSKRKFLLSALTVELLPFPMCEKLLTDEDFLDSFYTSPKIEAALAEVLPWVYERGGFDFSG